MLSTSPPDLVSTDQNVGDQSAELRFNTISAPPTTIAYFALSAGAFPSLLDEYKSFSGTGDVKVSGLVLADLERDGSAEIILQLSKMQSSLGITTNAATQNLLVILRLDADHNYQIATEYYLGPDTNPVLSGISHQVRVADVNGDLLPDIVWSGDKNDGRSSNSDMAAQTDVLLSNTDTGLYSIRSYGAPLTHYSVGATSPLGNYPGIVISAGTGGLPTVIEFGEQITTHQGNAEMQVGTVMHLPWLDNPQTGERYFYADKTDTKHGSAPGNPAIFSWAADHIWRVTDSPAANRFEPFSQVQISSAQSAVSTVDLASYLGQKLVSYQHVDANIWHATTRSAPLIITSLNVSQLPDPASTATTIKLEDLKNKSYLEFILATPGHIEMTTVNIENQDTEITASSSQVLDLNRDGYEDIVVYTNRQGGQPVVYLNDTAGGLYKASLDNVLPQGLAAWGVNTSSQFLDANQDGIMDILFWPRAGIDVSGFEASGSSYQLYLAQQALGTGPDFLNSAESGAPGFDEHFYLKSYPEIKALISSGEYKTGLEHYLTVGKSQGRFAFAIDVNVYGSTAGDMITLREGNEHAYGFDGNDQISGLDGNDVLDGGAGNDLVDGGQGFDTAVYSDYAGNYKISINADHSAYTVVDKNDENNTDTLRGIESIQFGDLRLNVTIQAQVAATPAASVQSLIELYLAFFNRVPDADGLSYWIDQLKAGQKLDQIAESFYNAGKQFTDLTGFSPTMSDADFVNIVYKNSLGRTDGADPEGLAYWTGELGSGRASHGSLVASILKAAHGFKNDDTYGWVADLLDNKILVGKTIAVDWGINFNSNIDSIAQGMAIAAAISANDTSVALELLGINSTDILLF